MSGNGVAPEKHAAPPGVERGDSYVEGDAVDVEQLNAPRWLKASLKLLDLDGDGLERHEIEETLYLAAEQKKRAKENSGEIDYSNFPPKVREVLATWDADGSGTVGVAELSAAADAQKKLEKEGRLMKKFIVFLVLILVGLCVMNFLMSAVAVETGKDMKPQKKVSARRILLEEFYNNDSHRRGLQDSVVVPRAQTLDSGAGGAGEMGTGSGVAAGAFAGAAAPPTRVSAAAASKDYYGYEALKTTSETNPLEAGNIKKLNVPIDCGCAAINGPFQVEVELGSMEVGGEVIKMKGADEKWMEFHHVGPKKPDTPHRHARMLADVLDGRGLKSHGKPLPPVVFACSKKACEQVPFKAMQGRVKPTTLTQFGRKLLESGADYYDLSDLEAEEKRRLQHIADGKTGANAATIAAAKRRLDPTLTAVDGFESGDWMHDPIESDGYIPPAGMDYPPSMPRDPQSANPAGDCPFQAKLEAEGQDQAKQPKNPPKPFDYWTTDISGEVGFAGFAAREVDNGGVDAMPTCREFVEMDTNKDGVHTMDEWEDQGFDFDSTLHTCQDTDPDMIEGAFAGQGHVRRRQLKRVNDALLTGDLGSGRRKLADAAAEPKITKAAIERAKVQKMRRNTDFATKVPIEGLTTMMRRANPAIAKACADPRECEQKMREANGGKAHIDAGSFPKVRDSIKPTAAAKRDEAAAPEKRPRDFFKPGVDSISLDDPNWKEKLDMDGNAALRDLPDHALREELANCDADGTGRCSRDGMRDPTDEGSDRGWQGALRFECGDASGAGCNNRESNARKGGISRGAYRASCTADQPTFMAKMADAQFMLSDINGDGTMNQDEYRSQTCDNVAYGLTDHGDHEMHAEAALGYELNTDPYAGDHEPVTGRALNAIDAHSSKRQTGSTVRNHPRRIKASLGMLVKTLVDRPRERRKMRKLQRMEKKLVDGMKRKLGGHHSEDFQKWHTARRLQAQSRHRLRRRMQAFHRGEVSEPEMHRHLEEHDEISDAAHKKDLPAMRKLLSDDEDNHLRNRMRRLSTRRLDYGEDWGMPMPGMTDMTYDTNMYATYAPPTQAEMMKTFEDMAAPNPPPPPMNADTGMDFEFDMVGGVDPYAYMYDSFTDDNGSMDATNFNMPGMTEQAYEQYDMSTLTSTAAANTVDGMMWQDYYGGLSPDTQDFVADTMETWFSTNPEGIEFPEILAAGAMVLGCMGASDLPEGMDRPGDFNPNQNTFTTVAPEPMRPGDQGTFTFTGADGTQQVRPAQNSTYKFDFANPPPAVATAVAAKHLGTRDPMNGQEASNPNDYTATAGATNYWDNWRRRKLSPAEKKLKTAGLHQKLKAHYKKFAGLMGKKKESFLRRLDYPEFTFPPYEEMEENCPTNADGTIAPPTAADYEFMNTLPDVDTLMIFAEQLESSVPEPNAIYEAQQVSGGEMDSTFLAANKEGTPLGGFNDVGMNPYANSCGQARMLREQVQRRLRRLRRRMLKEKDEKSRRKLQLQEDEYMAAFAMGSGLEQVIDTCETQGLAGDELHTAFPDETMLHDACHMAAERNHEMAENMAGNLAGIVRRLSLDEQEKAEHAHRRLEFEVTGGQPGGCHDVIDCCFLTPTDVYAYEDPVGYAAAMENPVAQDMKNHGYQNAAMAPFHFDDMMDWIDSATYESASFPDPMDSTSWPADANGDYDSSIWDPVPPPLTGPYAENTEWGVDDMPPPDMWDTAAVAAPHYDAVPPPPADATAATAAGAAGPATGAVVPAAKVGPAPTGTPKTKTKTGPAPSAAEIQAQMAAANAAAVAGTGTAGAPRRLMPVAKTWSTSLRRLYSPDGAHVDPAYFDENNGAPCGKVYKAMKPKTRVAGFDATEVRKLARQLVTNTAVPPPAAIPAETWDMMMEFKPHAAALKPAASKPGENGVPMRVQKPNVKLPLAEVLAKELKNPKNKFCNKLHPLAKNLPPAGPSGGFDFTDPMIMASAPNLDPSTPGLATIAEQPHLFPNVAGAGIKASGTKDQLLNSPTLINMKQAQKEVWKKLEHLIVLPPADSAAGTARKLSTGLKARRQRHKARKSHIAKKVRQLRMRHGDIRRLHAMDVRVVLTDLKIERERRRVLLRQRRKLTKEDREEFDKHHAAPAKGKRNRRMLRRLHAVDNVHHDYMAGDDGKIYNAGEVDEYGMPKLVGTAPNVEDNIMDSMELLYSGDFQDAFDGNFNTAEPFSAAAFSKPPVDCVTAGPLDDHCICIGDDNESCHRIDDVEAELAARDEPSFAEACVPCPTMNDILMPTDATMGHVPMTNICTEAEACEMMKDAYQMNKDPPTFAEINHMMEEGHIAAFIDEKDLRADTPIQKLVNMASQAAAGKGTAAPGAGAQEGFTCKLDQIEMAIHAAHSSPDVNPDDIQTWTHVAEMIKSSVPDPESFELDEMEFDDFACSSEFNEMPVTDDAVSIGDFVPHCVLYAKKTKPECADVFEKAEKSDPGKMKEPEFLKVKNQLAPLSAHLGPREKEAEMDERGDNQTQNAVTEARKETGTAISTLQDTLHRQQKKEGVFRVRKAMRKLSEDPQRRKLRESSNPLAYMENPALKRSLYMESGENMFDHHAAMYFPEDNHVPMPDEYHHYWEPEDEWNTMENYSDPDPAGMEEIQDVVDSYQYAAHEASDMAHMMSDMYMALEQRQSEAKHAMVSNYLKASSAINNMNADMSAHSGSAVGTASAATWSDTYVYSGDDHGPEVDAHNHYQAEIDRITTQMSSLSSAYSTFSDCHTAANTTDYAPGGARHGRRLGAIPATKPIATGAGATQKKEVVAQALHIAANMSPAPISADYRVGLSDCCDHHTNECWCGPNDGAYVDDSGFFDKQDLSCGAPPLFYEVSESTEHFYDNWGEGSDSDYHEPPASMMNAGVQAMGAPPSSPGLSYPASMSRMLKEAITHYPRRRTQAQIQAKSRSNRFGISLVSEFAVNWNAVKKHPSSDPERKARVLSVDAVQWSTAPNENTRVGKHDAKLMATGCMPWEHGPEQAQAVLKVARKHGQDAMAAVNKKKIERVHAHQEPEDAHAQIAGQEGADPDMKRARAEAEIWAMEAAEKSGDDPLREMDHMDEMHLLTGLGMDGPIAPVLGPDHDCTIYGPSLISTVADANNDGDFDDTGAAVQQLDYEDLCNKAKGAQEEMTGIYDMARMFGDEEAVAEATCQLQHRLLRRMSLEDKPVHPHLRQLAAIPHEFFDSFTGEVIRSRRLQDITDAIMNDMTYTVEPQGEQYFNCENGHHTWVHPAEHSHFDFGGLDRIPEHYEDYDWGHYRKSRRLHLKDTFTENAEAFLASDHVPEDQKEHLHTAVAALAHRKKENQVKMFSTPAAFNAIIDNPAIGTSILGEFRDKVIGTFAAAGETETPFKNIDLPHELPPVPTGADPETYDKDGDKIPDKYQLFHAVKEAMTYQPPPHVEDMLHQVAQGDFEFKEMKDMVMPKCVDKDGNSPQNPAAQKRFKEKLDKATEAHAGATCYDTCSEFDTYYEYKAAGKSPTLPTDPRAASKKCDCAAIASCGDPVLRAKAHSKSIKGRRMQEIRDRRRLVREERRRQLKEEPTRKLTVRELEADKWFERGVNYLLPAAEFKHSAQKKRALHAKNFFKRNHKPKTRGHSRRRLAYRP